MSKTLYHQAALEELDVMCETLENMARRFSHTLQLEQEKADEVQLILSYMETNAMEKIRTIITEA